MILVGEGEDQEPPDEFLKKSVSDTVLNLLGDYRYLTKGYYVSLHAEENNCIVFPSVKNALDVYRAPIFMERLKKAGIDIPNFRVLKKPEPKSCVLVPLNPFSRNSAKLVKTENQYLKRFKSLSMGYRYSVVNVEVEGDIGEFEIYLGEAKKEEFEDLAEKTFEIFGVPIGKVLFEKVDDKIRPFYFMPLTTDEIDFAFLKEVINENWMLCRNL
ncbi:MAG: RimK-like ATPgrasp N-terminal domain-containing protein [Archaeoglobaceae archaeon]